MTKILTTAMAHLRDWVWRVWQRRLKLRKFERRRADFLRYATNQNRRMGWDE